MRLIRKWLCVLALLTALLSLATTAQAQLSESPVIRGYGAPSGTCDARKLYLNASNGSVYSCASGTWTLLGGNASGLQPSNNLSDLISASAARTNLGLGNVDNVSDSAKPVSTAGQAALDLKANLASPSFSGTISGITKSMVGLGSTDNTADTAKPVSTLQQAALDLKANLASPTFSGTISGITKAMVGLGSVDNVADASKPISTLQQSALDLKAPLASPTFTGTVAGISKSMVGLGSADNTADSAKPVSTLAQAALDLKAPLASPTFTGTVAGITASMVGLGSVTNTSDAAKPVSTAQQTALDLKANLASPTFTGNVAGVTASMVGLGSVNNTADSAKPVSTAQQTALDLKANLTSPSFTTSAISPLFRSTTAKVLVQGTGSGATQLSATQTTAPTCTTSCGTSPSVVGTDTWMRVTMGATGTPASGWIVTFNGTWAAAPVCIVQSAKSGMVVGKMPIVVATTTTTITVTTNGTAPSTADVYQIHCGGTQ